MAMRPLSGLPATAWIARCAAAVLRSERPDLTLVYLPHLDYDPQRFGPSGTDMPRHVRELDDACAPLLDAAISVGARVWVVSEYGHCDVDGPVYPNRMLRQAGLLAVRLARATGQGHWLDYAFRLFAAVQRLPPAQVIDELYPAVRAAPSVSLSQFRAYLDVVRRIQHQLGPAERFLLRRLEGLEGVLVS